MEIAEAVSKYGTQAVLTYRDVAGIQEDNELPEIFLGGIVARGIHDELKLSAHVERFYTTIAVELGKRLDQALTNQFGGQRADVAVYRGALPIAVIEFKKFDDGKGPAGIVSDRNKIRVLARECGVSSYLGVLITDVDKPANGSCEARRTLLEHALEQPFDVRGNKMHSKNGKWGWCFACLKSS